MSGWRSTMGARASTFGLMMMLSTLAQPAMAASLTIDALNKMVAGLGFETVTDGKTYTSIQGQTVADTTIFFGLNEDGSQLNMYLPFDDLTKDKVKDIPTVDMLNFNNNHDFAFAIGQAEGKDRLVLEKYLDADGVSPATLRKSIESLKAAVDESQTLWKQDGWKPAAAQGGAPGGAPKTYKDYLAEADMVWESSPFALNNLMFVKDKASIFGAYHKRDTNVFKPGEPILTYAEPYAYTWKPTDGGAYQFGVSVDYTLLEGEKILGGQEKILSYSDASKDKIREFMLNATLRFNGLPPGKYTLRYTAHDMFADKTATASIPFEIAK